MGINEERKVRTSDDIHQFVGDGGLATTIVLHLQGCNHVGGVLRGVVHSVSAEESQPHGSSRSEVHTERSVRKRGLR